MVVRLLVLTCGTNASFHICERLKSTFPDDFWIIGADINDPWLVSTSTIVDSFYKIPRFDDPDYLSAIEGIIEKEHPDYILPSYDFDQQLFYTGAPLLKKYNITSLSTSKETLEIYKNKQLMNDFLDKNHFSVPKQYHKEECDDDCDYFIKPLNGSGSIGASVKSGKAIKDMGCSDLIIQELCCKPEITMECFHYGDFFTHVCRERIETKAGVCTKARIFRNNDLEKIARELSSLLDLPVIFNIQFMKSKTGNWTITDINLRNAGGMSISYTAGWDVVTPLGKIMLGQTENLSDCFPDTIPEQYIVRVYRDIVTSKKETVAFDLDGTLLDSRMRHSVVLDEILTKYGIEIDTSDLIEYKRSGKNNVDYLISKGISEELSKKVQKEWIEKIESEKYLKTDVLYPDSINLINSYSKHYRIVLITSRSNEYALKKQLSWLKLDGLFDEVFVVGTKNVVKDKSSILSTIKPTIFFGDTKTDYEASVASDVRFSFRSEGFHSPDYVFQ